VTYKLIFDEKAIEQIQKLQKILRDRIFKKLQDSKENPLHFFEKLQGRPEFKLRVGEYRIIADIDHKEVRILILYVDHRKRIYKRF
jgi:mRNA interferase RelE/StbE